MHACRIVLCTCDVCQEVIVLTSATLIEAGCCCIRHSVHQYQILCLQTFSTVSANGMGVDAGSSSPDDPGSLYDLLDDTSKSIVKPFLTTKFIVTSRPSSAPGTVGTTGHGGAEPALSMGLVN